MQKIPTIFVRDPDNPRLMTSEITEGCEWVFAGEGVPTEKYDGTCCAILDGILCRRHQHKSEKGAPPAGWTHWSFDPGVNSGHGWIPVGDSPADRWHVEAWTNREPDTEDGTYELVGPKVQKNPYGLKEHELWKHGQIGAFFDCERTFDAIRAHIEQADDWGLAHTASHCEGIVWYHPNGQMAKIKRRDFGLPWPVKNEP